MLELDSYGHFFKKAQTHKCLRTVDPTWDEDFELELDGSQTIRILCYRVACPSNTLIGRSALEVNIYRLIHALVISTRPSYRPRRTISVEDWWQGQYEKGHVLIYLSHILSGQITCYCPRKMLLPRRQITCRKLCFYYTCKFGIISIKYVISNVIIMCYRRANPGPTPYLWKFLYLIIIIGMSVLPSHDFMLSRSHRGFKMYWFLIVASHITIVHRRVGVPVHYINHNPWHRRH